MGSQKMGGYFGYCGGYASYPVYPNNGLIGHDPI